MNIVIQNNTIEPGQNAILKLSVGRLPSDTKIYLNVHVFRSTEPGPVVLFMSGVHGDEINSVEIVRRTLAQRWFEGIHKGTVVVIPLMNVYGFNNFSREVPDGKDVNRSFPGSANGSMAARVAHIFTKNILPVIDFGVDFHTGGNNNYNFPQIRYTTGHQQSRELADAFSAPYSISYKPIANSLRKTALDAKKAIIVYEGGENLRFDPIAIEHGLAGIKRLLHAQEMLPEAPPPTMPNIHLSKTNWMRTDRSGIFHALKKSGDMIKPGEIMAVVNDPYGMDEIPVVAKKAGYIIGHNNNPVVGMGDALFHIGV